MNLWRKKMRSHEACLTELVADLRHAVLDSAGVTDPAARRAAAAGDPVSPTLDRYLATVRDASYRVTDGDVDGLHSAGHPEDEIFELTIAAALGTALKSFDTAMQQLQRDA